VECIYNWYKIYLILVAYFGRYSIHESLSQLARLQHEFFLVLSLCLVKAGLMDTMGIERLPSPGSHEESAGSLASQSDEVSRGDSFCSLKSGWMSRSDSFASAHSEPGGTGTVDMGEAVEATHALVAGLYSQVEFDQQSMSSQRNRSNLASAASSRPRAASVGPTCSQADFTASGFTRQVLHAARNPKNQATAAGAIGGAVTIGTGGAAVGLVTGGAIGAACGVVPAIFTFGLSIPVGAAIGSGVGMCTGSAFGGTFGLLSGGTASRYLYNRYVETAEPAVAHGNGNDPGFVA